MQNYDSNQYNRVRILWKSRRYSYRHKIHIVLTCVCVCARRARLHIQNGFEQFSIKVVCMTTSSSCSFPCAHSIWTFMCMAFYAMYLAFQMQKFFCCWPNKAVQRCKKNIAHAILSYWFGFRLISRRLTISTRSVSLWAEGSNVHFKRETRIEIAIPC